MKQLLLKATFDHNITLLIFKKKNTMLQYKTIKSLSKQPTSSFNPTKNMPDSYLEIPEKSRNNMTFNINDIYLSNLLQNNLQIFNPEITTLKLIEIQYFYMTNINDETSN